MTDRAVWQGVELSQTDMISFVYFILGEASRKEQTCAPIVWCK